MDISYLANGDIKRVLLGVPEGHKHLRCIVETTDDRVLIFQEATIANLVRAYLSVKTHPQKHSLELVGKEITARKKDFASFQLLETERRDEEVKQEMNRYLCRS